MASTLRIAGLFFLLQTASCNDDEQIATLKFESGLEVVFPEDKLCLLMECLCSPYETNCTMITRNGTLSDVKKVQSDKMKTIENPLSYHCDVPTPNQTVKSCERGNSETLTVTTTIYVSNISSCVDTNIRIRWNRYKLMPHNFPSNISCEAPVSPSATTVMASTYLVSLNPTSITQGSQLTSDPPTVFFSMVSSRDVVLSTSRISNSSGQENPAMQSLESPLYLISPATAVTAIETPATAVTAIETPATAVTAIEMPATAVTAIETPATAVTAIETPATAVTAIETPATAVTAIETPATAVTAIETPATAVTAIETPATAVTAIETPATAVTAIETPSYSTKNLNDYQSHTSPLPTVSERQTSPVGLATSLTPPPSQFSAFSTRLSEITQISIRTHSLSVQASTISTIELQSLQSMVVTNESSPPQISTAAASRSTYLQGLIVPTMKYSTSQTLPSSKMEYTTPQALSTSTMEHLTRKVLPTSTMEYLTPQDLSTSTVEYSTPQDLSTSTMKYTTPQALPLSTMEHSTPKALSASTMEFSTSQALFTITPHASTVPANESPPTQGSNNIFPSSSYPLSPSSSTNQALVTEISSGSLLLTPSTPMVWASRSPTNPPTTAFTVNDPLTEVSRSNLRSDNDLKLILAAGVGGGLLVLVCVILIICILLCRRKRMRKLDEGKQENDVTNKDGATVYMEIDKITSIRFGAAGDRDMRDNVCYFRPSSSDYDHDLNSNKLPQSTKSGDVIPGQRKDSSDRANGFLASFDKYTQIGAIDNRYKPLKSQSDYATVDDIILRPRISQSSDYEDIDEIRSRRRSNSASGITYDRKDEYSTNQHDRCTAAVGGCYAKIRKRRKSKQSMKETNETDTQRFRDPNDNISGDDELENPGDNVYSRLTSNRGVNRREGITDSFLETYGPVSGSSLSRDASADVDADMDNEYSTLASARGANRRVGITNSYLETYGTSSGSPIYTPKLQRKGNDKDGSVRSTKCIIGETSRDLSCPNQGDDTDTSVALTSTDITKSPTSQLSLRKDSEKDNSDINGNNVDSESFDEITFLTSCGIQDLDDTNVYFELEPESPMEWV